MNVFKYIFVLVFRFKSNFLTIIFYCISAFSWHVITVTYSLYKKMEDENKRTTNTSAVYQTNTLPPQYQLNTMPSGIADDTATQRNFSYLRI